PMTKGSSRTSTAPPVSTSYVMFTRGGRTRSSFLWTLSLAIACSSVGLLLVVGVVPTPQLQRSTGLPPDGRSVDPPPRLVIRPGNAGVKQRPAGVPPRRKC